MSKELEAFNEIIDKFAEQMIRANIEELTATNKTNAIKYLYRTPQVRLLNEALQRLESIENAKPSNALELVGYLKDYLLNMMPYYDWLNDIEKYILKAQEQKQVLKIIKEKRVDFYRLSVFDNVNDYNSTIEFDEYKLTQEEFDLLKRYSK